MLSDEEKDRARIAAEEIVRRSTATRSYDIALSADVRRYLDINKIKPEELVYKFGHKQLSEESQLALILALNSIVNAPSKHFTTHIADEVLEISWQQLHAFLVQLNIFVSMP